MDYYMTIKDSDNKVVSDNVLLSKEDVLNISKIVETSNK